MIKLIKCSILIVCISACHKDTNTNRCAYEKSFDFNNECREVDEYIYPEPDENGISQQWVLKYKPETERLHPCFNPNNENEVVFYLWDREGDSTRHELVKADLISNQHYLINSLSKKGGDGEISWSINDDLLTDANFKIINIGTKRVYNFNTDMALFNPVWDSKGNNIYTWLREIYDENLKNEFQDEVVVRISWPEMEIFKTGFFKNMNVYRQRTALSKSNNLCYSQNRKIYQLNVNTKETKLLFDSDVSIGNGGADYEWHPTSGRLYFSSLEGIFYLEEENNKQIRIKKSCTSCYYESFTISPLGDKIVASRRDIKAERDGTYISENTKLVIMDIDGCNEKVLFEDWDGTVIGRP